MRNLFRRKRKAKQERDLEDLDGELLMRYHWLLVQQMEHDRKVMLKALRLSRKYNKDQPWVI